MTSKRSETVKYPFTKVAGVVKKFITVLQVDIDRLEQHAVNIKKFSSSRQMTQLRQEQVNASRTVQQVRSDIAQLQKLRSQLMDADLQQFDSRVLETETRVVQTLRAFTEAAVPFQQHDNDLNNVDNIVSTETSEGDIDPANSQLQQRQQQVKLVAITTAGDPLQNEEAVLQLHKDIVLLNGLMKEFSMAVHAQQASVDTIADHIEKAEINVREGTNSLAAASKLKAAVLPVTGAVLGAIVGGPLGLMVGAKMGVVAGLMGTAGGYMAGSYARKREQERTDEIQMQCSVADTPPKPRSASLLVVSQSVPFPPADDTRQRPASFSEDVLDTGSER